MDTGLLWIFLFLALAIGWAMGFYLRPTKKNDDTSFKPSSNAKHRLQLLFDTYSDETIDQFIHSLEVTPETLSIHLSIGKHFRTEGEVEKAILIHQNLMARPEFSDSASEPIIYELAKDYKVAGLFDRAETLLEQLQSSRRFNFKSLKLLMDIYEHERDWQNALTKGLSIELKKHPDIALRVAQYCCEIAEEKLQSNDRFKARQCLKRAIGLHKNCARAYITLARMDLEHKEYRSAISYIRKLAELSPGYIVLILPLLLDCTIATQSFDRHQAYLENLYQSTGQISTMLAVVESLVVQGEKQKASEFLEDQIIKAPSLSALELMLQPRKEMSDELPSNILSVVTRVIEQVKKSKAKYQCGQCGFSGGQLHWMCPSCKNWQTILPVVEYRIAE